MKRAFLPWIVLSTLCFGRAAEARAVVPPPAIRVVDQDGRVKYPMGHRTQSLLRQYLAWLMLREMI